MWSLMLTFLALFGSLGLSQYGDEDDAEDCGDDPCISFESCPAAVLTHRRGPPVACYNYDDGYNGVCCPPIKPGDMNVKIDVTTKRPKTSVSELMCEKYAVDYPCPQSLIVGGTDAEQDEFPHMVEIGFGRRGNYDYACGGSLISERWVLSAAHCSFHDNRRYTPRVARMGDVQPTNPRDGVNPTVVMIDTVILHPQYKHPLKYNDIALYRLQTAVQFSQMRNIRPICLHTQEKITSSPTAIGFGHTHFGSALADRLQKVSLAVFSGSLCNKSYPATNQLPQRIVDESMLCAGDPGGGEKDTCQGDSGASLLIRHTEEKCMNVVIGVTSFGVRYCGGGTPGVFTRVSHYVKWIEGIVWPEEKAKWDKTHPSG